MAGIHRKIIESPYGDHPDNFHVERHDDELHVTLTYPPKTKSEAAETNQVRYVVFDQESVRASDGIRISFDFDRNGYSIEQASWPTCDEVCDPDWQEVSFVEAWGREVPETKKPGAP